MFDSVRFNGISFRYVIPAWRPECNCQATGCWSTGESSERNETKVELSAEHRAKHNSLEKRWATLVDDKCACVWENELSSCISLSVGHPKSSRRARGVRSSDYSNVRSTGGVVHPPYIDHINHCGRRALLSGVVGPQIFANNCFVFSIPGN